MVLLMIYVLFGLLIIFLIGIVRGEAKFLRIRGRFKFSISPSPF
jgi:hypothetical protein